MISSNWQRDFEDRLNRVEKPFISRVYRYYSIQSNKIIQRAIATDWLSESDLNDVFKYDEMLNLYGDLYDTIGYSFATWYARNFDKYIKKGINPTEFIEPWHLYFTEEGLRVGAERVTLVQGTAKRNLIKVVRALSADTEYQQSGQDVKARMLRKQFTRYNTYQAKRLVRTESTNAANVGTLKSAQDIFPGAQMRKEWISAIDERTRSTHLQANGQIVDFNQDFNVGSESLNRPGDPKGSAKEVCNCRCSVAPFPVENAQAITTINALNGIINSLATDALINEIR